MNQHFSQEILQSEKSSKRRAEPAAPSQGYNSLPIEEGSRSRQPESGGMNPMKKPEAPVFHADHNCKNVDIQQQHSVSANVAVSNLLLSKLTTKQYSATLPQELLRQNLAKPLIGHTSEKNFKEEIKSTKEEEVALPEKLDHNKILPDIWKHKEDQSSILNKEQLSILERQYHSKVDLDLFKTQTGKVKDSVLKVLSIAAKHGSLNKGTAQCGICDELLRRRQLHQRVLSFQSPLIKIAQSNLDCKYTASQEYYNIKLINDIIYNEMTHLVCKFKDCLIMDDTSEFLKRFYQVDESKGRLPQILDFYETYSKVFPNYIVLQEKKYMFQNIERKQIAIDRKAALKHQLRQAAQGEPSRTHSDSNRLFNTSFMDSIRRDDLKKKSKADHEQSSFDSRRQAPQQEFARLIESFFNHESDRSYVTNNSRLSMAGYERKASVMDQSGHTSLFTIQNGEKWNEISHFEASQDAGLKEEMKEEGRGGRQTPVISNFQLQQHYETALSLLNTKVKEQAKKKSAQDSQRSHSVQSSAKNSNYKNKMRSNPQQPHSQTVSLSTCNENTLSVMQPYGSMPGHPQAKKPHAARSLSKNTMHTKSQGNLHTLSPRAKRMVTIEPNYTDKAIQIQRAVTKKHLLKACAPPTKPVIATHKLKIDIPSESPKNSKAGKFVERRKSSLTKKNSPGEYLQTVGEAYRHEGVGSSPQSPRISLSPKSKASYDQTKKGILISPGGKFSGDRSREQQLPLGGTNSRNTHSRERLNREEEIKKKIKNVEIARKQDISTQAIIRNILKHHEKVAQSEASQEFQVIASSSQPAFSLTKPPIQTGILNTIPQTIEHNHNHTQRQATSMTQMKGISNVKSLKDIRTLIKNSSTNPQPKLRGSTPKKLLKHSDETTDYLLQKTKQEFQKSNASHFQTSRVTQQPIPVPSRVRAGLKSDLISFSHSNKTSGSNIYAKASPPIPPQVMQFSSSNATLAKRPGAREPISRVSIKKSKKNFSPRVTQELQRTPGKHKRAGSIKSMTFNKTSMPSLAINLKHLVNNRTSTESEFTSASARTRPKSRHEPGRIINVKDTAAVILHENNGAGGALTDRTHQRLKNMQRNSHPKECIMTGFEFPPSRESASGKRGNSKAVSALESVAPPVSGILNFYGTKKNGSRSIESSSERVQFGGGKGAKRSITVKRKKELPRKQSQTRWKKGQGASRSQFFFPQELRGESRLLQNTDPSSLVMIRGSPQLLQKNHDPQTSERNSLGASSFRHKEMEPFLTSNKSRNKFDGVSHQRGASLGGILNRIKKNIKFNQKQGGGARSLHKQPSFK